jgi:phosphocarrier protein
MDERDRTGESMTQQDGEPQAECVSEVELRNPSGLHTRPAATFVDRASKFRAEVLLLKDGREANGKSILDLLALGAEKGAHLTLITRGPDAAAAAEALRGMLETGFDET